MVGEEGAGQLVRGEVLRSQAGSAQRRWFRNALAVGAGGSNGRWESHQVVKES